MTSTDLFSAGAAVEKKVSSLPEPQLTAVENWTPFAVTDADKMGPGGRFYDTIVVKGTFDLTEGRLRRAAEQQPIVYADQYWDKAAPERSSLKQAGDVVLYKPNTDVFVTGTVRTPTKKPLTDWNVGVEVRGAHGKVIEHAATVTGPRKFRYSSLTGWSLTSPEPALEVPIRYELAYGGAYPDRRVAPAPDGGRQYDVWRENPSGTGHFDERELNPGLEYDGPQWGLTDQLPSQMNKPVPLAGFGPVARHWSCRLGKAGTYDDAWKKRAREQVIANGFADYPDDFNLEFFQCAPSQMISKEHLLGDEVVVLKNMIEGREDFRFQLPEVELTARLVDHGQIWYPGQFLLDTVHVDLQSERVMLTWRMTLDQARGIEAAVIYTMVDV